MKDATDQVGICVVILFICRPDGRCNSPNRLKSQTKQQTKQVDTLVQVVDTQTRQVGIADQIVAAADQTGRYILQIKWWMKQTRQVDITGQMVDATDQTGRYRLIHVLRHEDTADQTADGMMQQTSSSAQYAMQKNRQEDVSDKTDSYRRVR